MKIGVTLHATDLAIDVGELAQEAESRGFHSLLIPEHTHIPTSRKTPAPTGEQVLAEEYKRSPDPLIALAAAATRTSRIRLGTGIALPAQHDPLSWAKQISTLDRIASGRLVLGIGYGWNVEEMENHGIDVKRRRARVRETMLAMQELWSKEVAEFHGDYVSFEASWQWPKPIQQPRPRTLIGGMAGPKLFDHIAEFADGWMPIGGAGLKDALVDLGRAVEARGRDPKQLELMPMGVFPNARKLEHYREAGVTECVLRLPSGTREQVLPVLDDYVQWIARGE